MTKTIPLTQGQVAIVDEADYEWLSQWNWQAQRRRNTFYAKRITAMVKGVKGKTITMHRQIMDFPDGLEVDHRDGDGLNNSRQNLRRATRSQNVHNSRLFRSSTSGVRGVYFNIKWQKWMARIANNGTRVYLGAYDTREEAGRIYDAAAISLHGEFARLNQIPTTST